MLYKLIRLIILCLFLNSCEYSPNVKKTSKHIELEKKYINSGFALVYSDDLTNIKKLETRSLSIYHKNLKKRSLVKITNPANGKYLITNVKSNKVKFSNFYNSVLSSRVAEELELNLSEPFVELALISKGSTFVAKKAKMFEEEREVAEKAPVDGIQINDLNVKETKKKLLKIEIFLTQLKLLIFTIKIQLK